MQVEEGSTVAVFGLGAVGLACIEGAVMAKAARIIAVDINPAKFEAAEKWGATECLNPAALDKPVQAVIAQMTDGGVDYSFEATGKCVRWRHRLPLSQRASFRLTPKRLYHFLGIFSP